MDIKWGELWIWYREAVVLQSRIFVCNGIMHSFLIRKAMVFKMRILAKTSSSNALSGAGCSALLLREQLIWAPAAAAACRCTLLMFCHDCCFQSTETPVIH
jgi:hypothetical protein